MTWFLFLRLQASQVCFWYVELGSLLQHGLVTPFSYCLPFSRFKVRKHCLTHNPCKLTLDLIRLPQTLPSLVGQKLNSPNLGHSCTWDHTYRPSKYFQATKRCEKTIQENIQKENIPNPTFVCLPSCWMPFWVNNLLAPLWSSNL